MIVLLISASRPLIAQPSTDSFLTRSFRGADILRVDSELELPSSGAFGIARVTITAPKRPSPADRNLNVVLYVEGSGPEPGVAYTTSASLREGQSQITVEIPHVQSSQRCHWDVAVLESGRDLEDKSQLPKDGDSWSTHHDRSQLFYYAALQGTDESPQSVNSTLSGLVSAQRASVAVSAATGLRTTNIGNSAARIVPIREAASDWRYFYPYAAWTVSVSTVRECNEVFPEVAQALRSYVAAGGLLFVHHATEVQGILEVERFLGGQPSIRSLKRWNYATSLDDGGSRKPVLPTDEYQESILEGYENLLSGASDKYLLRRSYLGGAVYLLTNLTEGLLEMSMAGNSMDASPNASSIPAAALPSAIQSAAIHSAVFKSTAFNATVASVDGNWFWRNLIEAVGKPPVWTFAFMVALFGLALGPGLLILTGRVGRRSLMILLVPLISFSATAAIIAYGIFHEGLDTYLRVTSVTRIDADNHMAFAWSRQNYYSGSPPREGLSLPRTTYARPVFSDSSPSVRPDDPRENVGYQVTLSDRQVWRGWLRPRQQQQLLIGHPILSPSLPLNLAVQEDGKLKITNQSNQRLPFVVLRGAQDDYYYAADLGPGETISVASITRGEAGVKVAREMVDFRPESPREMHDGGSLLNFGARRRGRGGQQYESPDVLNLALNNYLSENLMMKPLSFATILNENPQIEVPIEGRSVNGLHVVIGEQTW